MGVRDRREELTRRLKYQSLFILVWGPGASSPGYAKRLQIKERLKEMFPEAEVHFSEDPELDDQFPEAKGRPLAVKESYHFATCDLCVVLDTAVGAGQEVAFYAKSKLAHQLLVLTPEKYQDVSSYPADLRHSLNQVFFSEEEYETCNVVAHAVTRASEVALSRVLGITL